LEKWRNRKHQSRWDVAGRDVLAELIEHNALRKKRKLP
jgi:hypothetical protein